MNKAVAKQVGVVVVGVAIGVPLGKAADKGARFAFRKVVGIFRKEKAVVVPGATVEQAISAVLQADIAPEAVMAQVDAVLEKVMGAGAAAQEPAAAFRKAVAAVIQDMSAEPVTIEATIVEVAPSLSKAERKRLKRATR